MNKTVCDICGKAMGYKEVGSYRFGRYIRVEGQWYPEPFEDPHPMTMLDLCSIACAQKAVEKARERDGEVYG